MIANFHFFPHIWFPSTGQIWISPLTLHTSRDSRRFEKCASIDICQLKKCLITSIEYRFGLSDFSKVSLYLYPRDLPRKLLLYLRKILPLLGMTGVGDRLLHRSSFGSVIFHTDDFYKLLDTRRENFFRYLVTSHIPNGKVTSWFDQ